MTNRPSAYAQCYNYPLYSTGVTDIYIYIYTVLYHFDISLRYAFYNSNKVLSLNQGTM